MAHCAARFVFIIMTKEEQRKQVILACIALQQYVAEVAKKEMDSAQQQSNDYGANVDRYDSFRTKMMRQRDMYARQLSVANADLRILAELLRFPVMTKAEHGAIVVTNRQRFFLSVGIGKFLVPYVPTIMNSDVKEVEPTAQETYYAISAQVPIYMAMKGLEEGDSFTCNGAMHTIKEIL